MLHRDWTACLRAEPRRSLINLRPRTRGFYSLAANEIRRSGERKFFHGEGSNPAVEITEPLDTNFHLLLHDATFPVTSPLATPFFPRSNDEAIAEAQLACLSFLLVCCASCYSVLHAQLVCNIEMYGRGCVSGTSQFQSWKFENDSEIKWCYVLCNFVFVIVVASLWMKRKRY